MTDSLTTDDLIKSVQGKVYRQDYSTEQTIDQVVLLPLKNHVEEGGDFTELFRLDKDGRVEEMHQFSIAQINRARVLAGRIKAWHLHLKQDEFWYVSPYDHLVMGLWDLRKNSKTQDASMKIVLGDGESKLLFIPRGVAHGCANFSKAPIDVYYFINGQFDKDHPDEKRLPWNARGENFWTPARE